MESLFSEYIKLRKELEDGGGPEAVVENPGSELEKIYDRCYDIEDEILTKFGLPKSLRFREIVWDLMSKSESGGVINKLSQAAEDWLISSPRLSIELLEEAKRADLSTYEVLPEIGIHEVYHTRFYFDEYFKKGTITAQGLIDILKSIDEETAVKIEKMQDYQTTGTNLPEANLIFDELFEKKIPYLEELKNWRPVYPY